MAGRVSSIMSPTHNHSHASELLINETSHYDKEETRLADDDPYNVLVAKGVTMVVLCAVSTCMGILPMFLAKWFKWNASDHVNPRSMRTVSLLLGFGGGVLFCTTFLHLIPEVTDGVGHLVEEGKLPELSFSLAETLACTGFFVMYLVEECVHTHLRRRQASREANGKKDVNRSTNELVENGQAMAASCANGHSHVGHSHLPAIMDDGEDDFVITSLRGLLIVLGLSVHELFEGLAIGLESSGNYVWYMFGAVAAHKFVIAFCIGVELIASRTRRYLSIIYVCTFAVVSPIGIGVGMLLVGGGSAAASGPMAVILQGLASGTLLYVVFFEILQEHRSGLRQYFSILVGFVLMFGVQMLTSSRRRIVYAQGLLTSLLLCFGGGVLLFTTFLHLAPEVRASVERHQSNGQLPTLGSLSLAELLFCGGFFFVYLVEEAVHAALTGKPESSKALLYRTVSVRRCNNNNNNNNNNSSNQSDASGAMTSGSTTTVSTTTRSIWRDADDAEDEREARARAERPRKLRVDSQAAKDDKVLPAIFVLSPPVAGSPNGAYPRDVAPRSDSELTVPELSYPPIRQHHHHHHHHHHAHQDHHQHGAMTQNTSVQGLLTVLALSFHAIFEGLAVGLEPSISSVVYLAAAIATHKLVISFCVGMELYVAGASTKTTLGYLSVFSMVTPIGIAVGLALGHFKNDSENLGATPTILQGMAAGTLLYVVFFEVLARERANEKSGLLQLLAIIVGFALMLGLQIATAHSHSHSHSRVDSHGHSHGEHGGDHDDHDDEHENGGKHRHDHPHNETTTVLADMINQVTDSIVQELSNRLASSTTASPTTTTTTTTTTIQQRDATFNGTDALHRHS